MIAKAFRVWLGVEISFALAAVLSVARAPADTASNFAWPIQPVVMAAVFGAFYVAVAPTFVLAVRAKRWEMVRVFVLPGVVFTTALLVATIIHWEKFSVGTAPFNLWLASYVLPPPIYLAAFLWHQRRATTSTATSTSDNPLPTVLRRMLVVLGGLLTAEAVFAFVSPSYLADEFPWTLTPLTARVLCGFLLLVSTLLLSIARENDRDRVRVVTPTLVVLLPAVGLQVARYWDQVDTSSLRFWTTVGYLAAVCACGVYLARGSWRESLS